MTSDDGTCHCAQGDDQMITPAELATIVLRDDPERDVELRMVLHHTERGHAMRWHRSQGVSQGYGQFLAVRCDCRAEFVIGRVGYVESDMESSCGV